MTHLYQKIRVFDCAVLISMVLAWHTGVYAGLVPELGQQFVYDDTPTITASNKQWQFNFDVQVYDEEKILLVIPLACLFSESSSCRHSDAIINGGLLQCRDLYNSITSGTFFNDNIHALSEFCDKGVFTYSDLIQLQTVLSEVGKPDPQDEVDNAQPWMFYSASESVLALNYDASKRTQFSIWSDETALLKTQLSLVFVLIGENRHTDEVWNVQQHSQEYFLQKPSSSRRCSRS